MAQHTPDVLILSCSQLGSGLRTTSELERLRDMLSPLSENIRVIAHVDLPTRMLARSYAAQVLEGRGLSLQAEIDLAGQENWREAALAQCPNIDPAAGVFAETQAPNHWIDLPALVDFWEGTFGAGKVHLHSYDEDRFARADVTQAICEAFEIEGNIGKAEEIVPLPRPYRIAGTRATTECADLAGPRKPPAHFAPPAMAKLCAGCCD